MLPFFRKKQKPDTRNAETAVDAQQHDEQQYEAALVEETPMPAEPETAGSNAALASMGYSVEGDPGIEDNAGDPSEHLPSRDITADTAPSSASLFSRLKRGMEKTSSQLTGGLSGIFTDSTLDEASIDDLEDLLLLSDMGGEASRTISTAMAKEKFSSNVDATGVKKRLARHIAAQLVPVEHEIALQPEGALTVIMVVGVNGNGKTTTIGKLAMRYKQQGKRVMLAAADTFRAAAVEQLGVWASRADVAFIAGEHEADPASVAYQAVERATQEHADILLIDTAGRLQNKQNLMEELAKIARVIKKQAPDAPHHTLMVLDGTTGQNAVIQARTFNEYVPLTGFAVTKLDGTAKGGMVVALATEFGLPVHYVGVGEQIEDLQAFNAMDYAASLVGLERLAVKG